MITPGGYNTLMEVMQAGARCVAVPYAGGHESEQTLRCGLLAERGVLQMVTEDGLNAETMAAAIEAAMDAPPASQAGLDVQGAEKTAELLHRALQTQRGAAAGS